MRLLATHYIFREVWCSLCIYRIIMLKLWLQIKPNVFMNNRLSSVIDTGKPSAVIIEYNRHVAFG